MVNELSNVSIRWESLGKQLGMGDSLEDIRTQYFDHADCLREVLRRWLLQGLHTWSHVVHALKNPTVGESELGDHLKEKYLPGELTIVSHILGCDPVVEFFHLYVVMFELNTFQAYQVRSFKLLSSN